MANAATASHGHTQDGAAPREFSAFLRLRQGGAARTTWLLTETPGGTMISVGADAACDWQIRAAFVPPRAFSILVVGGRAFVRSGPEPGVLVNGKPIDDSWNALTGQARIDVGLARFEIRTGYSDLLSEEPVIELAAPRRREPAADAWAAQPEQAATVAPAAVVSPQPSPAREAERTPRPLETVARTPAARRKRTMETQEYGWQNGESSRVRRVGTPRQDPRLVTPAAAPRSKNKALRGSTIELNMDDLDYVGTIPMPRRGGERTSEYAVSPSLLGSDEVTRVTGLSPALRYVGVGAFFASAYGAWLYLLDRL